MLTAEYDSSLETPRLLAKCTRFSGLVHVLADGVRTGRVVPQKDEGVVDPIGTPEGIVLAELMNQALHLPGKGGPPTLPAGLPSPEVLESPGMPFLDGRRLHQMGEVFPPVQAFREDPPEQPKARSESWPWMFLRRDFVLTGGNLALCGQESGGQNDLGTEDAQQKDPTIMDDFARTSNHVYLSKADGTALWGPHRPETLGAMACRAEGPGAGGCDQLAASPENVGVRHLRWSLLQWPEAILR